MSEKVSTTAGGFDPRPHLRKLGGKDYLEVVYRVQWLRSDYPEATITTTLLNLDWQTGYAVFHARVEIPGKGTAEGTGSETREGFPAGWLEKAETVAVGRALAMLGYGTAFALADFEEGHPADCPVERPTTTPAGNGNGGNLATPAQLKLIYATATRDLHITEEELEDTCQRRYGRLPVQLTKAEASQLIADLRKASSGNGKAR